MTMPRNVPRMMLGRKFPKIFIDSEKCTVPFLCKKCLQICPTAVFRVERVMAKEEKLKEMDPKVPGNYVLDGYHREKCSLCNKCIEVCPVDAIRIEAPEVGRVKPKVEGVQWNR